MTFPMKRFWGILAIFLVGVSGLQAETWLSSPPNSDWDSGSNWDLSTVPNGTGASATFATSSANTVTMSAPTTVGDIQFNGSSSYTVYNNGQNFVLAGLGANNTSGQAQTLIATGGLFLFENSAQAVSVLLIDSGGATLRFQDSSSAGNAVISAFGKLLFTGTSTAGGATIVASSGGAISFSGNADGGLAQFDLLSGSSLDISQSTATGVTIGSLEGAGNVNLGGKNLTTGGNGLSTTYDGAITGTGALIKNGSDLMILTGTNNFSGGTSILGGTLVVNGGSLGTGPVNNQALLTYALTSTAVNNELNGGTLAFQDAASAGSATLTNNNLLAFNNSSSAATALIVNYATANFYGTSTAASAAITNGGVLNFNDASTAGNAAITNSGAVYFTGASAISVASAGNATIEDMNVVQFQDFSTAASSHITVENSSSLNFSGNAQGGSAQVQLNSGGTLDITGETSAAVTLALVNAVAGSFVHLGGNALAFNGSLSSSMAGTISGSGGSLIKMGTGVLTLSGSNTYSGSTQMLGGSLLLGNSNALGAGSLDLQAGTLATASGPMTVNVGGNYTQAAGGTLQLGLGGTLAGQEDLFNVTGNASLGGNLSILSDGGFTPVLGDSFQAFLVAGTISGAFNSSSSSITGFRFLPIYSTHEVDLVAIRPSFTNFGLTFNQKAVGAGLDASVFDPSQQNLMLALGTANASTLPAAYDRISPAGLTPLFRVGFDQDHARARLAAERVAALWEAIDARPQDRAASGRPLFVSTLDPEQERDLTSNPHRMGAFITGLGNLGTVTGDGNGPGYQFTTGGAVVGVDDCMSHDFVGGILLGYTQSGTSQAADSVQVSGGQFGLYGGWRSGSLHLSGLLDTSANNYTTTRSGYGGTASGTTRGMGFGFELDGGVDWTLDRVSLGLLAAGRYNNVDFDAFSESGSSAALRFPSQGQEELASELGFQVKLSGTSFEPSVKAVWEHLFQGNLDQISASLIGSSNTFMVEGPALGADGFLVSAGIQVGLGKGLAAQIGYQGVLGMTNFDSQNFSGGISLDL
jgi:autotransporter-associated beta strand protein